MFSDKDVVNIPFITPELLDAFIIAIINDS
jgi:hypothetical protein